MMTIKVRVLKTGKTAEISINHDAPISTIRPLIQSCGLFENDDYKIQTAWGKPLTKLEHYKFREMGISYDGVLIFLLDEDDENIILQKKYNKSDKHKEVIVKYFNKTPASNEACEKAFNHFADIKRRDMRHTCVSYGYIFSSGHPYLITSFIDDLIHFYDKKWSEDYGYCIGLNNNQIAPEFRQHCYRGIIHYYDAPVAKFISLSQVFDIYKVIQYNQKPPSLHGFVLNTSKSNKTSFRDCVLKPLESLFR